MLQILFLLSMFCLAFALYETMEYMRCYNDACILLQILFLSDMFCLVFAMSQCVLLQILFLSSMFCLVFAMSQCVLLQILFLSSMFCLVFVMSQRCMCLVSNSVPVKRVLSGVCYVTTMDVSCFRFCSCQACSVWCLRCYNDACVLLQILFLLRESGVCAVQDHGVHVMLQ